MNKNKHPYHDLIVEWAKDISKQPQITLANNHKWEDCSIHAVISNPNSLARHTKVTADLPCQDPTSRILCG